MPLDPSWGEILITGCNKYQIMCDHPMVDQGGGGLRRAVTMVVEYTDTRMGVITN